MKKIFKDRFIHHIDDIIKISVHSKRVCYSNNLRKAVGNG